MYRDNSDGCAKDEQKRETEGEADKEVLANYGVRPKPNKVGKAKEVINKRSMAKNKNH